MWCEERAAAPTGPQAVMAWLCLCLVALTYKGKSGPRGFCSNPRDCRCMRERTGGAENLTWIRGLKFMEGVGVCWWERVHECVFRPEEHGLGSRLLFKVLYTINRVTLVRQMLCLPLVAKLLLLAFSCGKLSSSIFYLLPLDRLPSAD